MRTESFEEESGQKKEMLSWRVAPPSRTSVFNLFGEADEDTLELEESVVESKVSRGLKKKEPVARTQSFTLNETDELSFMDIFNMEFIEKARETFMSLDTDGNGVLDLDEIKYGFTAMGVEDAYVDLKMVGGEGENEFTLADFVRAIKVQVRCDLITAHFKKMGVESKNTPLTVLDYNEDRAGWWEYGGSLTAKARRDLLFLPPLDPTRVVAKGGKAITRWVNLEGLDPVTVRKLAVRYGLHPIAIEDALEIEQRPKMDEYDHGVFVVVPMLSLADQVHTEATQQRGEGWLNPRLLKVQIEAVSIFLVDAERTVITVQEKPGDCWHSLRKQLNYSWSKARKEDHRFLLYCLLDCTTDALFPVIKEVLKCIDSLKDDLDGVGWHGSNVNDFDIRAVINVKKELLFMHRMLRPMRTVLDQAINESSSTGSVKYLRDVHSHMVQILEDIDEGLAECKDLFDHFNTKVANKQADVLYVLTFVTILLAPLQILTGLYGMNFDYIPELHWKNGYIYFWSLATSLILSLAFSFYRMGWLRFPKHEGDY